MRSPIDAKHCYLHGWLEGQLLGFCIPVFPLIPQVHLMERHDFEDMLRRYTSEFHDPMRQMSQAAGCPAGADLHGAWGAAVTLSETDNGSDDEPYDSKNNFKIIR